SICRKQDGGGGYAINIMGDARTLKVEGEDAIGVYHAEIDDDAGRWTSSGQRKFCTRCGAALWIYDDEWPELIHPFASAIDTPLPVPPSNVHLMLDFKAPWVVVQQGPEDQLFDRYPE